MVSHEVALLIPSVLVAFDYSQIVHDGRPMLKHVAQHWTVREGSVSPQLVKWIDPISEWENCHCPQPIPISCDF